MPDIPKCKRKYILLIYIRLTRLEYQTNEFHWIIRQSNHKAIPNLKIRIFYKQEKRKYHPWVFFFILLKLAFESVCVEYCICLPFFTGPPDFISWFFIKIKEKSVLNDLIPVLPMYTEGLVWSWSYGSWIYNYLCNQYLLPLKLWVRTPLNSWRGVLETPLCDKVCHWLATGLWFSTHTSPSPIKLTTTI